MTTKRFYCELCEEWVEHDAPTDNVYEGIAAGMEHFRVLHPETFAEIEKWPDGAPVVVHEEVAPEDFA
jgi:hypothetical protein